MASGQPDWTRQVAVTVFDAEDVINVNVQTQAAPIEVEFPETQDVNVLAMPASTTVAVASMPASSGVQIKGQDANLDVDIASVPENMTVVPSLAVIAGRTAAFEDSSFLTGDSPATHDVNAALGRNARDGYIICDGAGDIKIEISNNGTTWGGSHTLKEDDVLNLRHLDVDTIRVTWVTNSAYRIMVV